jgi:hypothetical protein
MNAYTGGSEGDTVAMRTLDEESDGRLLSGGGEGWPRVETTGQPWSRAHSIHVQVERVLLLFDAPAVAVPRPRTRMRRPRAGRAVGTPRSADVLQKATRP